MGRAWIEFSEGELITDAAEYCEVLAIAKKDLKATAGIDANELRISPSALAELREQLGADIEAKIEAVGITVKVE